MSQGELFDVRQQLPNGLVTEYASGTPLRRLRQEVLCVVLRLDRGFPRITDMAADQARMIPEQQFFHRPLFARNKLFQKIPPHRGPTI